jgi:hypothetical protein
MKDEWEKCEQPKWIGEWPHGFEGDVVFWKGKHYMYKMVYCGCNESGNTWMRKLRQRYQKGRMMK